MAPYFFGPLKVWHDYADPPPVICQKVVEQSGGQKIIDFIKLH